MGNRWFDPEIGGFQPEKEPLAGPFAQALLRSKQEQARLIAEMEGVENMPTAEPSSSNWQIRIEALRAAAVVYGASLGPLSPIDSGTVRTIAKRFERYLESGE